MAGPDPVFFQLFCFHQARSLGLNGFDLFRPSRLDESKDVGDFRRRNDVAESGHPGSEFDAHPFQDDLSAARDIAAGEELLMDYQHVIGSGEVMPFTDSLTGRAIAPRLYIALGIIGATVMPHNLYLHSGIVQTRAFGNDLADKRQALRMATWDSTLALMFALTINASILILAAAAFHASGNTEIVEIDRAHALLSPLLGGSLAPALFGLALLACGLNATITATMSGQIVMEGFIRWRISPAVRRLITRGFAILPAMAVIFWYGSA